MSDVIDWDGEAYCLRDNCSAPATIRLLEGMVGDYPLYELVCAEHGLEATP